MNIDPMDLEVSTYSTGSGWGRSDNVGVRLLHLPTRISAECSAHRVQHLNRLAAYRDLQAKIAQLEGSDLL